jgi:transcriptional regulator with XRE-family HTH domain
MNQFNVNINGFPKREGRIGLIDPKAMGSFGNFLVQSLFKLPEEKDEVKIAKEIGVSPDSIRKWEEGESFPKEDNLLLEKIARAYGVSMEELLREMKISKDAHGVEKKSRKGNHGPSSSPSPLIALRTNNGRRNGPFRGLEGSR